MSVLPRVFPPVPLTQGSPLPGPEYRVPSPAVQEYEAETPSIPLSHYIWILRRHCWKILVFILICVLATFIVSSRLQPIYESTAAVDVDRQAPSGIVGQESNRLSVNDADQFLATQIKLIQSDAVLRPVAQKFKLLEQEGQISALDPGKAQRTSSGPVRLKRLKVTRPPNTYLLFINYRSPDPQMASDVANGIASSFLEHTYNIRIRSSASLSIFMEKQIDELKAKMERSGHALAQFEREIGVVNPEEKTNILSARLLQLNTEYTNAQSDRVKKEAGYNSMKSGTLEAVQVSAQGESLAKLTERLNEARQRLAQVRTTHGANHPEVKKVASEISELTRQFEDTRLNIGGRIDAEYRQALNREQMLQKAVAETKRESDLINARSFEYQQLKREAEADKKLYEQLVSKIKEAGINAGFQNNNIRIADLARPGGVSVFPDVKLNLLLALLFSTLLAVGAAVLSDTLDTTIRDPEQASRYLGTDVIGILPSVKNSAQLSQLVVPRQEISANAGPIRVAALNGYHEKGFYRTLGAYQEAIRTLRNTVLLRDFHARIRSILITSAGQSEGKSTTAVHLAKAHAEQGQRTLLVDVDLRRPSVHRKLNIDASIGFSNVLIGEKSWRETVQPIDGIPNLFVIPSGPPSHRAGDLVGPPMAALLDELAREFDLVIMDAPPLLGFAEPLRLATLADGVLIVSQAGETKRKAVSSVLTALQRVRAPVLGLVLNQMKRNTSDVDSYYAYYRSGYYYKAES